MKVLTGIERRKTAAVAILSCAALLIAGCHKKQPATEPQAYTEVKHSTIILGQADSAYTMPAIIERSKSADIAFEKKREEQYPEKYLRTSGVYSLLPGSGRNVSAKVNVYNSAKFHTYDDLTLKIEYIDIYDRIVKSEERQKDVTISPRSGETWNWTLQNVPDSIIQIHIGVMHGDVAGM